MRGYDSVVAAAAAAAVAADVCKRLSLLLVDTSSRARNVRTCCKA